MDDQKPIFKAALPARRWAMRKQIALVYKEFGIKARTQSMQMVKLAFGKGKVLPPHYFTYGLYRSTLSNQTKRQFIGTKASHRINRGLSPKKFSSHHNLLTDKIAYATLMEGCGFSVARTQAFFHPLREILKISSLKNADAIKAFLTSKAEYPLFGKPQGGSRAIGTASVITISTDGSVLTLGNGREVSTDQYVTEITNLFPEGYLFQSYVEQHPKIIPFCKNAVGTVRMVTLLQESGPELIYAIWKIPSEGAMVDNGETAYATNVFIDVDSGETISTYYEHAIGLTEVPLTDKLRGMKLPNWGKMRETAIKGHLVTHDHGVLGWDIAMGKTGPVIIEANPAPLHTFYQTTTSKPFLNDKFSAKINAATEFAEKRLKQREDLEILEVKRNTTERVNKALGR